MDRKTLDKKVALLQWFSSLEDEETIDELVQIMSKEELKAKEFARDEM